MKTKYPEALAYHRTYYKETLVPRSAFFGLVRWEEVLVVDQKESEVLVYSDLPVRILPLKDHPYYNPTLNKSS